MPKGENVFEGIRTSVQSEEEIAVDTLFPFRKNKFQMLQAITELHPRAVTPFSVLGVFRRRFKSEVLKQFQEEHNLNKIAQERKGRLELAEVWAAAKRAAAEERER